jgi:DNA-binding CsgD family transcriptional regulator/PAS domain-containing protein
MPMPATSRVSAPLDSVQHQNVDEALSSIISGIYDAALDSGRWCEVLAAIAGFVGGQAGGLLSKSPHKDALDVDHYVGVDPRYLESYRERYSRSCPLARVPFVEPLRIVSIPELVPYNEYLQGQFYQEWAQPQGWLDVANIIVEKSEQCCSIFSVVRDESSGMVDCEMRRRMMLLAPHIRRATLVRHAMDGQRAEIATFAATLDRLSAGLFLLDTDGRIVHANAAGRDVLQGDDFLRSVGGRLIARDVQVHQTLRDVCEAAGGDAAAIGLKGAALPLVARGGEHYVAHALPLSTETRQAAALGSRPVVALFVRKVALQSSAPADIIGKAFKLTPAELRVLLAIVDVGGVPEVAAALGVAESTVKTHLGRLFEKTGAGRQADLVKLAAGFSTPLAN